MSDRIILAGTERMLKPMISQIMALHQLLQYKDIGQVYGTPVQNFQELVKFKPQIHLYFEQVTGLIDSEFGAVTARLSFRIMNESAETMTPDKAKALATKINSSFGGSSPFHWEKGKHLFSYSAPNQGVQTKIYTTNESEAKQVIKKILGLQNFTLNDDYLKDCSRTVDLASPQDGNQGKEMIYGTSRRLPRKLPLATVQFTYAEMLLHGLTHAICLVDMTGKKHEPLIRGYLPISMQ